MRTPLVAAAIAAALIVPSAAAAPGHAAGVTVVGRDRPAHRCHDLTTLPHTAQPEDLEVEEPAPAGSSPTPTLRASSRSTGITDDESSPVDQG